MNRSTDMVSKVVAPMGDEGKAREMHEILKQDSVVNGAGVVTQFTKNAADGENWGIHFQGAQAVTEGELKNAFKGTPFEGQRLSVEHQPWRGTLEI